MQPQEPLLYLGTSVHPGRRLPPTSISVGMFRLPKHARPLHDDNKKAWFLTTVGDLAEMRKNAAETDPHTLRLHTRKRNEKLKLNTAIQKAMWDAGIERCATCTAPILNPHDPEYAEKVARIERMSNNPLPKCICCAGANAAARAQGADEAAG